MANFKFFNADSFSFFLLFKANMSSYLLQHPHKGSENPLLSFRESRRRRVDDFNPTLSKITVPLILSFIILSAV